MRRNLLLFALVLLLTCLPALAAENGVYTAGIAVSDDVLGLTDAVVLVSDAGITARVTATTGDGETLYVGEAAVALSVNARGEFTYTLPIAALDEPVEIEWFDTEGFGHTFTLTVTSEDLEPLGGAAEPAPAGEAVDPATLADGSYAVADFAFSGGSGKVTITCAGIEVKDGAAEAEIVFSSPRYGYVKVDGVRYEGAHTEETSSFRVPVRLGEDMTVVGMTTAMSQPHEIEYTLRIVPGERLE